MVSLLHRITFIGKPFGISGFEGNNPYNKTASPPIKLPFNQSVSVKRSVATMPDIYSGLANKKNKKACRKVLKLYSC